MSVFRRADGKWNYKFWLLIGGLVLLVVIGVGLGVYFGVFHNNNDNTASSNTISTASVHPNKKPETYNHPDHPKQLIPLVPAKSNEHHPDHVLYVWQTGGYGPCGKECGGSVRTRDVWCWNGHAKVHDEKCQAKEKPSSTKMCNTQPCDQFHWDVTWSECHKGNVQTGSAVCIDSKGNTVDESSCNQETYPVLIHHCNYHPPKPKPEHHCNYAWHYDEDWGTCEGACPGPGMQTRTEKCQDMTKTAFTIVDSSFCEDQDVSHPDCPMTKEPTTRQCPLECHHYTYRWVPLSDFTDCSKPCGNGNQSRQVECHAFENNVGNKVDDKFCDAKEREKVAWRACNTNPCQTKVFMSRPNKYLLHLNTAKKSLGITPGYFVSGQRYIFNKVDIIQDLNGQSPLYLTFFHVNGDHNIYVRFHNNMKFLFSGGLYAYVAIWEHRIGRILKDMNLLSTGSTIVNTLQLDPLASDQTSDQHVHTYVPFHIRLQQKGKFCYLCVSRTGLRFIDPKDMEHFSDKYMLAEFQLEPVK